MLKNILKYIKEHGVISVIPHAIKLCRKFLKDTFYRGNYYVDMDNFIDIYKGKYPDQHRKTALMVICWQVFALFRKYDSDRKINSNNEKNIEQNSVLERSLCIEKLNIGILPEGGLGDYIIVANWLYKFRKKFAHPNMNIEICYGKNEEAVKVLFANDIADNLISINREEFLKKGLYQKYDLFFDMERIPFIRNADFDRIKVFSTSLAEYVELIKKYMLENVRYSQPGPRYHGQVTMLECINGRKRIQQPDVYGFLGITEKYEYKIQFDLNKDLLNSKWKINEDYIAVVSGADINYGGGESNKIWPMAYWQELLPMIKEKYPHISIVQLGVGSKESAFDLVDYNLLGETTIKESMLVLKHARVLISNEGGLVHVRHAIGGGPSVVMFGSTDEKFFGYSENYNIRGNACPYSCEWQCRDWQRHCFNEVKGACMLSVKPEVVLEAVIKSVEKDNINE